MKTVIIGFGNLLVPQDSIGIQVIRKLKSKKLSSNIDIVEGGTDGSVVMDYASNSKKMIIIDGIHDEKTERKVYKIDDLNKLLNTFSKRAPLMLSHDVSWLSSLWIINSYFKMQIPSEFVFYGIGVKNDTPLGKDPKLSQAIRLTIEDICYEANS